jgi:hypothetical protein
VQIYVIYTTGIFDVIVTTSSSSAALGGLCGDKTTNWTTPQIIKNPTSQLDINSYADSCMLFLNYGGILRYVNRNFLLGRVSITSTLFDYIGTSFSNFNQPNFIGNYSTVFASDMLQQSATAWCSQIIFALTLTDKCASLVKQRGLYFVACMCDIAGTSNINYGDHSVVAFSRVCSVYNADHAEGKPFSNLISDIKITVE